MPIVPGNEPRQKKTGSSIIGWLLPLLIFGPPLYRFVRSLVAGRVTDQQLLIIVGGVAALVALVVIVQRVNRVRSGSTLGLPTTYQPPSPSLPPSQSMPTASSQPFVPRLPQFEPIITGKVVLVGIVLAGILAGIGFLVLLP